MSRRQIFSLSNLPYIPQSPQHPWNLYEKPSQLAIFLDRTFDLSVLLLTCCLRSQVRNLA